MSGMRKVLTGCFVFLTCLAFMNGLCAANGPGEESKPFLGVQVHSVTEKERASLGVRGTIGLFVEMVVEGSAAQAGGLRKGDVLLSWNQDILRDTDTLVKNIQAAGVGAKASLTVFREGKLFEIKVQLKELDRKEEKPREKKVEKQKIEKKKIQKESPGKKELGVAFSKVPPVLVKHLFLSQNEGLMIVDIRDDSLLRKMGLSKFDILLQVGAVKIAGTKDIPLVKKTLFGGGQEIPLLYIHQGKIEKIFVRIKE